jgi:hypothetical protein
MDGRNVATMHEWDKCEKHATGKDDTKENCQRRPTKNVFH